MQIFDLIDDVNDRLAGKWYTESCDIATGKPRSNQWPAVRKAFLKKHPVCAACGGKFDLTPHHIKPFHLFPELELDEDNLITLCPADHLVFGHLGDFSCSNPFVIEDCQRHRQRVEEFRRSREQDRPAD